MNVDRDGIVWVCGTHNDTINRFDPTTETLVEFRLPTRVSYTREIEFDDDGNVWTSTSGPARHMERGVGAVIRIALPKELPAGGGIKLTPQHYDGNHDIGNLAAAPKVERSIGADRARLFAKIDAAPLPAAYSKMPHQKFVDARMAGLPEHKRSLVGSLWHEFRQANPDRRNDGQFFVRILEHVSTTDVPVKRRFVKKWQHHQFGNAPNILGERNLERGRTVFEAATCSRCHNIGPGEKKLGPDLTDITKRFKGSRLLNQIVRPSAEIHKDFQTQLILCDDGKLRTGLVIKETDDELHFIPNLLKPDKIEVLPRSSIEERQTAKISTMPEGLLNTFSQAEIFDLLAYIQSANQVSK